MQKSTVVNHKVPEICPKVGTVNIFYRTSCVNIIIDEKFQSSEVGKLFISEMLWLIRFIYLFIYFFSMLYLTCQIW